MGKFLCIGWDWRFPACFDASWGRDGVGGIEVETKSRKAKAVLWFGRLGSTVVRSVD